MKLNTIQIEWSRRYQAALRKHLAQSRGADLKQAFKLGCNAVLLHLETLDVIRVHEQALLAMISQKDPAKLSQLIVGRAKRFFTETLVPIEKTHRAAIKDDAREDQLARVLQRRTEESIALNRQLQRSIVHRQSAEASLKRSRSQLSKLLHTSTVLQKQLRTKTHAHLTKHEAVRRIAGRQLQDEIVQTLIAVKVQMETLKRSAHDVTDKLKKEIAETQLLVKQSVKAIKRLAQEVGTEHEA